MKILPLAARQKSCMGNCDLINYFLWNSDTNLSNGDCFAAPPSTASMLPSTELTPLLSTIFTTILGTHCFHDPSMVQILSRISCTSYRKGSLLPFSSTSLGIYCSSI